jgi:hypothetical protein
MTSTRHSIEQAVSIQRDFEAAFASRSGVVGVGIGMNRAQDDFALNVFVSKSMKAPELPESFNGLDVVVDVVDGFKAY